MTLAREGRSASGFSVGQTLPELTIELDERQKWIFADVKILSSTPNGAVDEVAFSYGKLEGPATGFGVATN